MKLMTSILFSCFSLLLFSQTQIQGNVLDTKGNPIFGVNVSTDRMEGSVTDFDGKYTLVVKEGSFILKLSAIGYQTQNKEVNIAKNEILKLNFTLKEEQVKVDDVVVYGSKRGKRVQEEIQSVEIVKADILENNNVTDGISAVNLLSGVSVLDGQISVRGGSGYAYGVGSRVILAEDGVPSLTPERDEINWDFIATENIEQIELLKGGGGVQYGSSALNGVLSVRSAWAKKLAKPETEVTLYHDIVGNPKVREANWWKNKSTTYLQSPHTLGASFVHRRKMKKNVDLVFSGMGHSFQSHLKDEFNERIRINANFRHRPVKIQRLTYGVFSKYMYRNDSFFFMWNDNGDEKYTPLAVYGKRYHYVRVHPFVTYYDKKGSTFKYNGFVYYDTKAEKDAEIKSVRIYNDFQYEKKFKFGLSLSPGLTIDNKRVFAPSLRDLFFPGDEKSPFKFSNYALYLLADYKYKGLNLSAGGRYELVGVEKLIKSTKPVFYLGANYAFNKNDYLRFSISQSFRVPNVAEKYVDESLGEVDIYPNPEIQPETGYNAELGYKRMLNYKKTRGSVDFAFFWTEFENMIEFNFGNQSQPGDSTIKLGFKAENVAKARIFGWELNVEEKLNLNDFELTAKLGYTYLYGVDLNSNPANKNIGTFLGNAFKGFATTKKQHKQFEKNPYGYDAKNPLYGLLKYRFRHILKLDLGASYKNFGLGMNLAYYSYIDNLDQVFILFIPGVGEERATLNYKGTTVLNLRTSYTVKDRVKFSFIIKNVTNTDYAIRPAKPNAPRSFTFQTKFLF